MKVITEIESVNLSNGDRTRRVVGDGESRIERSRGFVDEVRLGPSQNAEAMKPVARPAEGRNMPDGYSDREHERVMKKIRADINAAVDTWCDQPYKGWRIGYTKCADGAFVPVTWDAWYGPVAYPTYRFRVLMDAIRFAKWTVDTTIMRDAFRVARPTA